MADDKPAPSLAEPAVPGGAPAGTQATTSVVPDQNTASALDSLADVLNKANGGQPTPQPPTTPAMAPVASTGPTIPPPPAPTPGAYSPDQEQAALRFADGITDPQRRFRVKQMLKQEYTNDAIMDGVVEKGRTEARNKAISEYATAIHQVISDHSVGWQAQQAVAKKLVETMWQDPRTDYAETRELLQAHMLGQVGAPNEGKLGRGYTVAQDGVVNRTITANEQILKMEQQGLLTHEGATWTMQSLKELNEPKGVVNTDRTEFFKRFSRSIAPRDALGEVTALGEQRLYLAERASRAREQELIERKGNPADVYNPDSKDYFGAPQNLAKYSVSLKEATDYAAAISKGGAVIPPPIKGDVPPPPSVSPAAPAPKPIDVSGMTRAEVLTKFKPGTSVLLPDGRVGVVPYPVIPMSR